MLIGDLIQIVQDSSLRVEEGMVFFYVKSIREVLGLPMPGKRISTKESDKLVAEETRQRHS